MDAEGIWRLFLLTGMPEAYLLYQELQRTQSEPKSA